MLIFWIEYSSNLIKLGKNMLRMGAWRHLICLLRILWKYFSAFKLVHDYAQSRESFVHTNGVRAAQVEGFSLQCIHWTWYCYREAVAKSYHVINQRFLAMMKETCYHQKCTIWAIMQQISLSRISNWSKICRKRSWSFPSIAVSYNESKNQSNLKFQRIL